jgi:hypothetical protein
MAKVSIHRIATSNAIENICDDPSWYSCQNEESETARHYKGKP